LITPVIIALKLKSGTRATEATPQAVPCTINDNTIAITISAEAMGMVEGGGVGF